MKTFDEYPVSFIYVHLDFIKDTSCPFIRGKTFGEITAFYESITRLGDNDKLHNAVLYYRDEKGNYCITNIENINDSHVIQLIKQVSEIGRDAEDAEY